MRLLDEKHRIYEFDLSDLTFREIRSLSMFKDEETFNEKTNWSGVQTLITPKGRETFRLLYIQKTA